jgi:GNAT superfamily N-acetyltransferase
MSEHYEVRQENFLISTDKSKLNVDVIHRYLCEESYWAKGIPRDVVERSIVNSICFGMYDKEQQIGFARVISDKATFAYLADVFILPAYRGKNLGKWLMQTIHEHPELQDLRRWWLGTKDAHGLYEQYGWTRITDEVARRFMQKHDPDIYKRIGNKQ